MRTSVLRAMAGAASPARPPGGRIEAVMLEPAMAAKSRSLQCTIAGGRHAAPRRRAAAALPMLPGLPTPATRPTRLTSPGRGLGRRGAIPIRSRSPSDSTASARSSGSAPRPICRSARRRDSRREPLPRTADDHHCKEATAMSPLQHQKRLRLYEARSLLLRRSRELGAVAASVGYDKLSQFHREYQRQFGLTPLQDAGRLRAAR
ncbi:helix-turn-helix domain-containing protein [Burkholderia gladioli]|uniref:helix-turn-helix domain-containing protein n=2 Tax=Burkholderia gladioli TaxID=28095 RepID=UPI001641AEE1